MPAGRPGRRARPARPANSCVRDLLETVPAAYRGCRWVVTSRPAAYTGEVVLPDFAHAHIDPLSEPGRGRRSWPAGVASLYLDSPEAAGGHCAELLAALRARPDIRRLARNPVMLTALAVVHWNERRLPEQRADLYESIIRWLSRSREQRPGPRKGRTHRRAAAGTGPGHAEPSRGTAYPGPQTLGGRATGRRVRARTSVDRDAHRPGRAVPGRPRNWTAGSWSAAATTSSSGTAPSRSSWPPGPSPPGRMSARRQLLWGPPPAAVRARMARSGAAAGRHPAPARPGQGGQACSSTMLEQLGHARGLGRPSPLRRAAGRHPPRPGAGRLRAARPSSIANCCDRVLAIFDRERIQRVPIEVRIAAADALGQAGDPRLDSRTAADYWVTIPAGKFLMGAQNEGPAEAELRPEVYVQDKWRRTPSRGLPGRLPLRPLSADGRPIPAVHRRRRVSRRQWWRAGGFGQFSEPEGGTSNCSTHRGPSSASVGSRRRPIAPGRAAGCRPRPNGNGRHGERRPEVPVG